VKIPDSAGVRFIDIPMRGDIIALSFSGDIDQHGHSPAHISHGFWSPLEEQGIFKLLSLQNRVRLPSKNACIPRSE